MMVTLDRTPEQLATQRAHIYDDRKPDILAAQISCFVIAYVGVGLRFWARRLARAQITTDDYWIITALVLFTAASADGFVCLALGAGKHEITLRNLDAFAKASFPFIVLYRVAVAAIKFSVLALYRRLFPQARFRTILTWYSGLLIVYTVVFILLDIFHCQPVSHAWGYSRRGCLNMNPVWVVGGSLNAVTDIITLCLPLPLLWRLHVTREKSLELIGIFLLGGFVCIVSIIRVVKLGGLSSSYIDATYVYATYIIWSTVEVGVGILCACLPILRPVLNVLFSLTQSNPPSRDMFQPGKRGTTLRMKSFHRSHPSMLRKDAGIDDRAPFAYLETSAIRDSNPKVGELLEEGGGGDGDGGVGERGGGAGRRQLMDSISVTTRIEQAVDRYPPPPPRYREDEDAKGLR